MGDIEWDDLLYRYEQIAQIIAGRIRAGVYPPRTVLSEVRLEAEFGVSRPTIRQAFALLRDQGLITTRRGKGSIVLPRDVLD